MASDNNPIKEIFFLVVILQRMNSLYNSKNTIVFMADFLFILLFFFFGKYCIKSIVNSIEILFIKRTISYWREILHLVVI